MDAYCLDYYSGPHRGKKTEWGAAAAAAAAKKMKEIIADGVSFLQRTERFDIRGVEKTRPNHGRLKR